MSDSLNRRTFLASTAASLPLVSTLAAHAQSHTQQSPDRASASKPPVLIASANGKVALERAMEQLNAGSDPLDAIVAGIKIVEDDPEDMSVGYGGLPNEEGVVELDASCLHGPSHKAGAVAGLQRIKNPASVALQVLRRTDHVLLVGEGALKFARAMGFQEENLLTEKAREAWLKWKANLNENDDWLNQDQEIPLSNINQMRSQANRLNVPFTTGTVHCSAVDAKGDIASCTSTSGLSWKLPGRVGDSPIVGAGMFCDNNVGAAGATGRGEAMLHSCGAFQMVNHMANGMQPTEACLKVLQWIADHTKQKYLLDAKGRPNFGLTLYAVRKDGAYGSAAFTKGTKFAVCDARGARLEECAALYPD